jgi:Holliday junction DNA helicase RuvB
MPELEAARAALREKREQRTPRLQPVSFSERSANEFRPSSFAQMVGQERLKALLARMITCAIESGRPLEHALLVGAAGVGKTTLAQVIAQELGRPVYMLGAPIDVATLSELARVEAGSVVIVDEVHLQASDPEPMYSILEDCRLVLKGGVKPFPALTWIGCTTDAGKLPAPFLARWPLHLRLDAYTDADLVQIAQLNARQLGVRLSKAAANIFAWSSRGNPRQINAYVRSARALAAGDISQELAVEVIETVCETTLDGLTRTMRDVLLTLLDAERTDSKGEMQHKASLLTLATAAEVDQRTITQQVEPWLVRAGLVVIAPGGRALTAAGIVRARALA